MKQIILSFLLVICISSAKASDTLTVRQVFNFNVGDTFDYVERVISYDYNLFPVFYSRKIISQKYISPLQDTIIYNRNWVITHLDSIAVYQLDTLYHDTNRSTTTNFTDTNTFHFLGKLSNDINTDLFEGGFLFTVTENLGETIWGSRWVDGSGLNYNSDITTLIYYSNGNTSWGTPYYIAEGLNNISNDLFISLSPNPSNNAIHLSISELNSTYQFTLTNLLGQEVLSQPVTQTESSINITSLTPGIYLWQLASNGQTIKTGKLVKE